MTYYIGIDPDLHHAGIAIISDNDKKPLFLGVARTPAKLKGEAANVEMAASMARVLVSALHTIKYKERICAFVESQRIYPGSSANQNSLLMLAQSAGIAVGILSLGDPQIEIELVAPSAWKGQIEKLTHQEALANHLAWRHDNAPFETLHYDFKASERSHVLDAFGLACYGIIRDSIPRDPSRTEGASVGGMIVTRDRLVRLESRWMQPR